jgi:hypothetical protein
MSFDTTRLVNQVTLKGSLPEGRFEDQEILDLAYDALLSEIVPMVLEAREEYFITFKDFAITANQSAYPIPSRALNGVLREAKLINGTTVINLTRKEIEDIRSTATGTPTSFYLSGNDVCLYPTPANTQFTLRLYYFIRPSRLVTSAECAQITDISGNTVTVTIPTGWSNTNTFDLVRGRAHFDTFATDLTATSVADGTITFSANVPSTLVIGDYVALTEETCFPFLPPEGHVALIQSTVTSALESIGDPAAATSAQKSEMLKSKFQSVLETRVQGEPKRLGTRLL